MLLIINPLSRIIRSVCIGHYTNTVLFEIWNFTRIKIFVWVNYRINLDKFIILKLPFVNGTCWGDLPSYSIQFIVFEVAWQDSFIRKSNFTWAFKLTIEIGALLNDTVLVGEFTFTKPGVVCEIAQEMHSIVQNYLAFAVELPFRPETQSQRPRL